jgi:hypothetical protein
MYKQLYPSILLLITTCILKAQPKPTIPATRDSTIRAAVIRHGKYSNVLYTLNGEPVTEKHIENLMQSYPIAAAELKSYKLQKRKTSTAIVVFTSVGFGSLLAAIIQSNQAQNNTGTNFSKAPVFFSLSIGSFISELFFLKKNDHFTKAIEAYNSRL